MLQRVAIILCAVSLLQLAVALNPYYLYISPVSPTISYYPNVVTDASTGWNVSYSNSLWERYTTSYSYTSPGYGSPTVFTNSSSAALSFNFVGTGFTAYGWTSYGGAVGLTLDGSSISTQGIVRPYSSQPVLAAATNLTFGRHDVTLTLKGTGGMQFSGLSLLLGAGDAQNPQTYNISTPAVTGSNSKLNDAFSFSPGQWTPAGFTDTSGSNELIAQSSSANASYTIQPPGNTSILVIYGSITPYDAPYTVQLTSGIYDTSAAAYSTTSYRKFDNMSPWAADNVALYYATLVAAPEYGMDSAYTVEVQSAGAGGARMTLNRAEMVTAGTTTILDFADDNSANRRKALIGGLVGGILGLLLVIAALVYLVRRKRSRRGQHHEEESEVKCEELATPSESVVALIPEDETASLVTPYRGPFEVDPSPGPAGASVEGLDSEIATTDIPRSASRTARQPNKSTEYLSRSPVIRQPLVIATAAPSNAAVADTHPAGSPMHSASSAASSSQGLLDLPTQGELDHKRELLDALPSSSATSSSAGQTYSIIRRETDAGRVEETLPPDYNPAWLANPSARQGGM